MLSDETDSRIKETKLTQIEKKTENEVRKANLSTKTYLGTYTGCTDDRISGVGFFGHCYFQARENGFQFVLIRTRITNSVHIHLEAEKQHMGHGGSVVGSVPCVRKLQVRIPL